MTSNFLPNFNEKSIKCSYIYENCENCCTYVEVSFNDKFERFCTWFIVTLFTFI